MRWTWRNAVLAVVRFLRRVARRPARLRAHFACAACERARGTKFVWSDKEQRNVPFCEGCYIAFEYVNESRDNVRRWQRGRRRRTQ